MGDERWLCCSSPVLKNARGRCKRIQGVRNTESALEGSGGAERKKCEAKGLRRAEKERVQDIEGCFVSFKRKYK